MGRANLPHPLSSLAPLLLPSSCAQAEASALLLWGDARVPAGLGPIGHPLRLMGWWGLTPA